ncbi:MAG: hypothetical protein ACYSWQ_16360 [Planctomycetota bacterium]|jgi:hypothetical protein
MKPYEHRSALDRKRTTMETVPVKRYRVPAYPTRLEVLANPDILAKNVPHRWQQNALTATALSVFLAANGCTDVDARSRPTEMKAAVVAPIFEHGSGRGATGCVVVAPPVFLSEEEAMQVITEELDKTSLEVTGKNVVLKGIEFPQRRERLRRVGNDWNEVVEEIPGESEPLSVDITDDKHEVAVEYISRFDYFRLGGARSSSTVQGYNFKDVATDLAEAVEKKGPGVYFGTFYDPMTKTDWRQFMAEKDSRKRWEQARAQGEVEAKRLLRLQVKDFVDWLKGQGVI